MNHVGVAERPEATADVEAAQLRQDEVEDDDLRLERTCLGEGRLAVGRGGDLEALALQQAHDVGTGVAVVLDDEYAGRGGFVHGLVPRNGTGTRTSRFREEQGRVTRQGALMVENGRGPG